MQGTPRAYDPAQADVDGQREGQGSLPFLRASHRGKRLHSGRLLSRVHGRLDDGFRGSLSPACSGQRRQAKCSKATRDETS
jgi:hypothetical protein